MGRTEWEECTHSLTPEHHADVVLVRHAPLSAHHALKVKATAKVSASPNRSGIQQRWEGI